MPTAGVGARGSIRKLGEGYREGSSDPSTTVRGYLKRIGELNPSLNCYITVLGESALREAEESERRFKAASPRGPLEGIPVAVKDIFYVQGVRCTAGSKILADFVAPYDAPAVRRLKAAGAVLLGTTNLHEFASGTTSVNPHFGSVRNPWDGSRVAGGSSGGSASAVAADLGVAALGTDTAGSVRIPASLCGVVGLKPTYGRISRLGVVPLATSLDTVGFLTKTVWDSALLLQVLSGHDDEDMTTVKADAPDYVAALSNPFTPVRVGIPRNYFLDDLDPGVRSSFEEFVSRLKELGCGVAEIELDGAADVFKVWLPIRRAEATAFHLNWLRSSPELYGEDVRAMLEQGKEILAVDYVNAINARPSFIERFTRSMEGCDIIAVPSTSIPAPMIGQTTVKIDEKEISVYQALNRLTYPISYVGFPSISIPSGDVGGLPVGVQLVGRLFDELSILKVAAAYEESYGPFPLPPQPWKTRATP